MASNNIVLNVRKGTGSIREDCYGTFKKLVRNSTDSRSDNFQRWPKFLVSYKNV